MNSKACYYALGTNDIILKYKKLANRNDSVFSIHKRFISILNLNNLSYYSVSTINSYLKVNIY